MQNTSDWEYCECGCQGFVLDLGPHVQFWKRGKAITFNGHSTLARNLKIFPFQQEMDDYVLEVLNLKVLEMTATIALIQEYVE